MYKTVKLQSVKILFLLAMVFALALSFLIPSFVPKTKTAAAVGEEGVVLPIVMYHGVLKEAKYQGKYVISPDSLESDLKYLQQHGYTPVFMQEVIDYVKNGAPLPEKPIVLSFDDGFYNNYYYALPLAREYQAKMVIAPVGSLLDAFSQAESDHPTYSYLTWQEAAEMQESGFFEFQNHSYNLHSYENRNGIKIMQGESYAHYREEVGGDLMLMQDKFAEHLGVKPTTMVYPFGAYGKETVQLVKELSFEAVFTCTEKLNVLTAGDTEPLYSLGRYRRPHDVSSEIFFEEIMDLP